MSDEHVEGDALLSWVASVDHKQVGLMYLGVSIFFLIVGGIEALLIRLQLAVPNNTLLSPETFNEVFTMHGTTMIFLVVMPILIGFGNYLVPLMIGAREVAFPRINAFGFWMLLFGGLLLYYSFLAGGAPAAGWFSYAPLSEQPYSTTPGMDYWALGLLLTGVGTVTAGLNFIVTIFKLRAPGLSMSRLPLFVWMMLVTSFLILFAMPALNAALIMLIVDRWFAGHFFSTSPVLWQHYFWSFGHPEVYIMALPGFGMISEVIPVFARKPIFGYGVVAMSSVAIAFLSYGVWVHHMFAVGLGTVPLVAFGATSMLIAVPTGIKIFNWMATMWGGRIRVNTAMLFAVAFLIQFTIGGLSGIIFAMVPLDWQLTDTYFVVAHFHYVLFGGTLFAIMAATYYWFPKMSGRLLNERLGRWNFWLLVLGFNLTFFVQHFLGLLGMPRRVYTYGEGHPYWTGLNLVSTHGAFLMAFAFAVMLWNIGWSLRHGELAGNNPWRAWTLEWATSSPPPEHNFEKVPPVRSRRPLWDLAHPDQGDFMHAEAAGREDGPRTGFLDLAQPQMFSIFFILSELTMFVFLIVAYALLHNAGEGGPRATTSLDVAKAGVFTVLLLASSVTLWMGERALHRGDRSALGRWLGASVVLGAIFLAGQGSEYMHLFADHVTIGANIFGTSFFTLTGVHGIHVLLGLVSLSVLLVLTWLGPTHQPTRNAVTAVSYYWHFVDVVWIGIFSLIYLGANL
ncbi:MAG TPA: cytochrome c oxidase subunit I [Candidatus Xenobia bacterium]